MIPLSVELNGRFQLGYLGCADRHRSRNTHLDRLPCHRATSQMLAVPRLDAVAAQKGPFFSVVADRTMRGMRRLVSGTGIENAEETEIAAPKALQVSLVLHNTITFIVAIWVWIFARWTLSFAYSKIKASVPCHRPRHSRPNRVMPVTRFGA
jgi:hypothetical protein